MPAASSASTSPSTSGASGPTTTKSIRSPRQKPTSPATSVARIATHSASSAIPALPGAQIQPVDQRRGRDRPGERMLASARPHHQHPHRACSCARLSYGDERSADRSPAAGQHHRIYRLRAVAGTQALDRGRVRPCPRARRGLRLQAARVGSLLFRPEGRRGGARRGVLADDRDPPGGQARGRDGGGVHRPAHHLSRPLEIPDRHRFDRIGRHRRAAQAARRAAPAPRRRGAVRGRAQKAAAVSARGDRGRDLADRGGDPRHPAPARRPLPAPGADLAGGGAGRERGGPGCGGDRGFQPPAAMGLCRGPI